MNKREMTKFKKLLEAERDHLRKGIKTIEANTMEAGERDTGGDLTSFAEAGTDNNERDTALRVASDESQWLREVAEALQRIEDGKYGTCESCEQAIPKKRLEVFPSALHCVECQSKVEKENLF